jgi:hypothetical protein
MFKKQAPLTLEEIDGKILHQDRWIVFLIILGMAAILFTVLEVHQINSDFEKAELIEESR